jgi:hypothetical protein
MKVQIILARTQSKKIWFKVSITPQRQHFPSPLQPLLTKDCPSGNLLLKVCHRKNFILREILHFYIIPAILISMPLLDKLQSIKLKRNVFLIIVKK